MKDTPWQPPAVPDPAPITPKAENRVFDPKKIEGRALAHLNRGKAFNISNYQLFYEGKAVGSLSQGREKKTYFKRAEVAGKIYELPADRDAFLEAVKAQVGL